MMNRRSFWYGFLLALAILLFWFWQKWRRFGPVPALEQEVSSSAAKGEDVAPDPLEEIAGIGPVFARRLEEAGIRTFRQLAILPAERIHEIVQIQPWQADVDSWIEQARARG